MSRSITSAKSRGLLGKLIVLDPGHADIQPGGWLNPGAIGPLTGLQEKDVVLDISFKLKTMLEEEGARVVLTHKGRTELALKGRAQIANNSKADIFVSIHANSSERRDYQGHSTFFYAPAYDQVLATQRPERERLATLVQRELVKAGQRKDIGVLEENFAVLRETKIPSVLVETAFISHSAEEVLLESDSYRKQLATGILKGIKAYFSEGN